MYGYYEKVLSVVENSGNFSDFIENFKEYTEHFSVEKLQDISGDVSMRISRGDVLTKRILKDYAEEYLLNTENVAEINIKQATSTITNFLCRDLRIIWYKVRLASMIETIGM